MQADVEDGMLKSVLNRTIVVAGDFHAAKAAMAPPTFEVPTLQLVYATLMAHLMTFSWALTVVNSSIFILIDVYSTLHKQHHHEEATAARDDPKFMVCCAAHGSLCSVSSAALRVTESKWPAVCYACCDDDLLCVRVKGSVSSSAGVERSTCNT